MKQINLFVRERIPSKLLQFKNDNRGMVAIEAALIIPLTLFVIIGSWELYQYFRTASVADRTAFLVANSLAMQKTLYNTSDCTSANTLCTYNRIASDLMTPLDYSHHGSMVISLYQVTDTPDGTPPVWKSTPEWQTHYHGSALSTEVVSHLHPPAGFPAPSHHDSLIAVEVSYRYTPFVIGHTFWQSLGGEKLITSTVFYRPRFNTLSTLSE